MAGKNTIAVVFARQHERCAVIDVNLVRAILVQSHTVSWEGDEGRRQQHLDVHHACLLTRSFPGRGCTVVLHDVLADETTAIYRRELRDADPQIVLLLPTLAEIRCRTVLRPSRLTPEEVLMLYRRQVALTDYDEEIDTTSLVPDAVAARLNRSSG